MNKRSLTQQMLSAKKSFKECGFSAKSALTFAEYEACATEMLERTVQFFPDGQACYKPGWLTQINFMYLKYFTDIDTDPYDTPEGRESLWGFYCPTYMVSPEDVGRGWKTVSDIYDNLKTRQCLLLKNENSLENSLRNLVDSLNDLASSVALNPVDDKTLASVVDA